MDAAARLTDFPDKLGPVFVRDLRQGLRTQIFVWAFLLLQAAAIFTLLIDWGLVAGIGLDSLGISFPSLFTGTVGFLFWFVLPLSQFGALQSELGRGRNIELLLCSQLTRWQIVRGKWFVACALSALLLISLLPFFFIRYFIGGVELVENLSQILNMLVSNATMNAIVIGASGFANHLGRAVAIILATLTHAITVATLPAAIGFRGTLPEPAIAYLASVAGAIPYILLGLQLGRSRIRVFENPLDPPTSAVILILMFCTPILHGIATAAAGVVGSLCVLAVISFLAIAMDPGPGRRKELKGAQP